MVVKRRIVVCLLVVLVAGTAPAWSLDGHFVHGVGARNEAMGGAGAGLPTDALSALAWNPALLTRLGDYQFQFGIELLKGSPEVESTVETPFGPFSGRTEDDTDTLPIPQFGWSHHAQGSRVAYGMGALALAGFFTDYPQDSTNPLLAPQPQGFGRVNSEYQYLRIPLAVAYQATAKLSVGGALTLGYARLGATAAAFAAPDCAPDGSCYYPAANQEGSYGWGAQVGLFYQATPAWSIGASYNTEERFQDFEYNSEHANPALPTFGTARRFSFGVDAPAQAVVGLGWQPAPSLSFALDGRWYGYSGTDGLGTYGFNPDGSIRGFGWDDIYVLAFGAEWRPSPAWSLRGGWNHADSPIVPERAFFSTAAPATFQDHLTLGLGLRLTGALTLDVTGYRGFEQDVTGPFVSPAGPVPGTSVTQRNSADSLVTTLSFSF